MVVSNDINPYALMAFEREFVESIMPPPKKSFTDAYKKTVNTLKEQSIEFGAEPMEDYESKSASPEELVKVPVNETLQAEYHEMNKNLVIDLYA